MVVAQSRTKIIESQIDEILKITQTPGAAVAIVKNDTLFLCRGFGYRDLEKKLKVDKHTIFSIGSSSKAFTGALIGIAQQKGFLELDTSPRTILKDLSFFNNEMNNGVTIRDLLSHRTGLPRHDLSWYLFPEKEPKKLWERIKYLEPYLPLRQGYHYNNFGYLVLGALAESTLDENWGNLIQKHLFEPLKMKRSSSSTISQQTANIAVGYQGTVDGKTYRMPHYDLQGMTAAGGINSTASDMVNWVRCWLNLGNFKENQILPKPYVIDAMSSQSIMRANLPNDEFSDLLFSNYGFGWMLSSYKGYYRVEHGGNINGFSANVCFFPSESLGIVVLTNQNNSDAPHLIRNMTSDLFLESNQTDWIAYHKKKNPKLENNYSEPNQKPSVFSNNLNISGTYLNMGYGEFTVEKYINGVYVVLPIGKFDLVRSKGFQYEMKTSTQSDKIDLQTVPELLFEFDIVKEGNCKGVSIPMEPTLSPIYFKKVK